jgi:TusA-related sulfurtransferase
MEKLFRKIITLKEVFVMEVTVNKFLDAKGLACPMPIVKTKKEMTSLEAGQVLEIQATDKGSTADLN